MYCSVMYCNVMSCNAWIGLDWIGLDWLYACKSCKYILAHHPEFAQNPKRLYDGFLSHDRRTAME